MLAFANLQDEAALHFCDVPSTDGRHIPRSLEPPLPGLGLAQCSLLLSAQSRKEETDSSRWELRLMVHQYAWYC